jgi:hypothetical protein
VSDKDVEVTHKFSPIEMSFITYLVVKQKLKHLTDFSTLVKRSSFLHAIILVYLIGMSSFRKYWRKHMERSNQAPPPEGYEEQLFYSNDVRYSSRALVPDTDDFLKCDEAVDFRLLMMFVLIFLPSFCLTFFGGYLTSLRIYKRRIVQSCVEDDTNRYNMNTLKILRRTENFMIIKNCWVMVGFTIWSLRNIFTLIQLFEFNCFTKHNSDKIYKFWMLNFIVFTLSGYIHAVITLFFIPGMALYQCYKETDRSQDINPYNKLGKSETGQTSIRDQTYSMAVFDQHQLASKRKFEKMTETQITLDEIRQTIVDIIVKKTFPKVYIWSNYEDILIEAFDGNDNNVDQISLIKELLQLNRHKCDVCKQMIKFNHVVRVVLQHDCYNNKSEAPGKFSHIIHSECYFKQLQG